MSDNINEPGNFDPFNGQNTPFDHEAGKTGRDHRDAGLAWLNGYYDHEDTPDIASIVMNEIYEDGDNDSDELIDWYVKSDGAQRKVIDDVLTTLCGWTLPTLIGMALTRGYIVGNW
jgi:hypothetical protein